jgi:ubiquinone/menaquinone biosynthesis C-methylase UbiE
MKYVDSGAENIPFPTGHFDAAFSFNSLDHVRDLDKTVAEIKRIVKPGGLFLLITELGHEPTPTEPQTFSFEILDRFSPEFTLVSSVAFQMQNGRVYESIQAGQIYDRDNPPPGRAILCAKFERKKSSH